MKFHFRVEKNICNELRYVQLKRVYGKYMEWQRKWSII